MEPKPWTEFAVGSPSVRPNWVETNCAPLRTISHVAHVPVAVRIVEDGRLRADLVFDKSKLNTNRIRVVWLSPNDWSAGFRYGNVRFIFDWPTLVANKKAYWIESIAYGVPACRILVTDVDRSAELDVYDPSVGDGPWWIDSSGKHYWNGKYCLEIMLEGDLELGKAESIDFVAHHEYGCNIDHKTCAYRGVGGAEGGADFFARLAFQGSLASLPGLTRKDDTGDRPSHGSRQAIDELLHRVSQIACKTTGSLMAVDRQAPALARTLLRMLASNDPGVGDPELVASQFQSLAQAEIAMRSLLVTMLGLPEDAASKIPLPYPSDSGT